MLKSLNVIHINNKRSDNSQKINLCIESEMLEVKSHAKYLGVLLDDNLNWKAPDWKVCTAHAISCARRNVHGFQPWPRSWQ